MYVLSAHRTLLAVSETSEIKQQSISTLCDMKSLVSINSVDISTGKIASGPLFGYELIEDNGVFYFKNGNYYLCADRETLSVSTDRLESKAWEAFTLIHQDQIDSGKVHGSPAEEMARFSSRVAQLRAESKPVKLYIGAGEVPRPGFINIDMTPISVDFSSSNFEDYFIFPCVDIPWDIPDNSVDYIFHEDFIEHIDQTNQFRFFAEALRVLKPGCWHRVNTPDLIWTMKMRSDFSRGMNGVYTGERQWGHIAIFTHCSLAEVAKAIGYSEVVFTTKDRGVSAHAEPDYRPRDDRDNLLGNIYADLLKG